MTDSLDTTNLVPDSEDRRITEWIVKRRHFGGSSIVSAIVTEEEAKTRADELNEQYQTTIYSAEKYINKEG